MYYVYIITNRKKGTLYTGVTSNLCKRIYEHKHKFVDGFSKKYDLKMLVYYEVFTEIEQAIKKEKQLKRWKRNWKIEAIQKNNPDWDDLYETLI